VGQIVGSSARAAGRNNSKRVWQRRQQYSYRGMASHLTSQNLSGLEDLTGLQSYYTTLVKISKGRLV
jgi:hypothetical protein